MSSSTITLTTSKEQKEAKTEPCRSTATTTTTATMTESNRSMLKHLAPSKVARILDRRDMLTLYLCECSILGTAAEAVMLGRDRGGTVNDFIVSAPGTDIEAICLHAMYILPWKQNRDILINSEHKKKKIAWRHFS